MPITVRGDAGVNIFRGGDVDELFFGLGGKDTINAADGRDTIYGGDQRDGLHGQDGDDRMFGGADNDTIDGGDGEDRYHGGQGADTFVFTADGEEDRINDFEDGVDVIDVSAFALAGGFADIQAGATQDGDDVYIDLGGGDVIKLNDTLLSEVTEDDFIFA